MKDLKYLQKVLFLLVMGLSLSFVYACGDDEDEPIIEENTGGGEITIPNDSIPTGGDEELPQDSISNDSVPGGDEPLSPADSIIVQGHVAVDLGLSVKWATCNVGANSPEEYGDYYAWGETTTKSNYDWDTYTWCNGTSRTITKYCTDSNYGAFDNKTILDPSDDVAHVEWSGSWRMPTLEEIQELINHCSWEWVTYNGVNGQLVTGSNGNSIFLPAAGIRRGTDFIFCGSNGHYWTTTLYEGRDDEAYNIGLSDGYRGWDDGGRSDGRSIRPVID